MTYYERLVRTVKEAMDKAPRSTVVLDAEDLTVISKSTNRSKAARSARDAVANGRTPVIIEKPRNEETWIL